MSNHSKYVRGASRAKKAAALSGGALVAASPLVTSGHVEAGTFTVTNLLDSGDGSLRAALEAANANADVDTIVFQSGLTGTITLTGQLEVLESATIQGPGASGITVDANDTGMVFYVYHDGGSNIDVTISGLTITGGTSSGITNWGEDLTLNGVVITGNSIDGNGGGLYSTDQTLDSGVPTLTILNSTISNNEATGTGGGVFHGASGGPMSVVDSVISDNTADEGGGVYVGRVSDTASTVDLSILRTTVSDNESTEGGGGVLVSEISGQVEVTDSTVSGNSAGFCGGGFYLGSSSGSGSVTINRSTISGNSAVYQGGGVYLYQLDTRSVISNSTVSGNSALDGGGVWAFDAAGGVGIQHSTISGNTVTGRAGGVGGYYNGDGLVLTMSIVAGNSAVTGDDFWMLNDPDIVAYYSLIGSLDGSELGGSNNVVGVDPMLGALADNGGETKTMLPQAGSAAIDAGAPSFAPPPATDQRGLSRLYGGRIDIGAVETQPVTLPPTGGSNGLLAGLGAALLGLGGALHLSGKRRRTEA